MDDDLADTVIRAPASQGRRAAALDAVDEDTLLRARTATREKGTTDPLPARQVLTDGGTSSPLAGADGRFRFRVNGGEPVPTDIVTLIGRAPRPPRVPGASDPRLIIVPSPSHEVSATHLEVRQQGTAVVVTDLRSTNGTFVSVLGADRRALRPGESFVVGPGSVVDIGDGNTLEVLAVDRLVPDDHFWKTLP